MPGLLLGLVTWLSPLQVELLELLGLSGTLGPSSRPALSGGSGSRPALSGVSGASACSVRIVELTWSGLELGLGLGLGLGLELGLGLGLG